MKQMSVSADGQFAAFADNRSTYALNVYRVNVATGQIVQASLNSKREQPTEFWGANSSRAFLSPTGRFVGFISPAGNLDLPELTIENSHAYVKDLETGVLRRVTKHSGSNGNCEGKHRATTTRAPRVSTDGNLAVFSSQCKFVLAPGDTPKMTSIEDVFVRDVAAQTTRRLSVSSSGAEADGASVLVGISADARYVLFGSDATNIVADDTNGRTDLFVRNRSNGTTRRISLDASYDQIDSGATEDMTDEVHRASISRNGKFVVFLTAENLLPSDTNAGLRDVYLVQLFE
jgi:Tol biopolymer transport system component